MWLRACSRPCCSRPRSSAPRRITFIPTVFYNTYSFAHPPALRIKPGDRVVTKTIDAGGVDWNGKTVASGPNPETGPFYIEGAEPGDMIVVSIEKLETNRASAYASSLLAPYTVDPAGDCRARRSRSEAHHLDDRQGARRGAPRSGRAAAGRHRAAAQADARLHRRRAGAQGSDRDQRARAPSAATWTTRRWAPA